MNKKWIIYIVLIVVAFVLIVVFSKTSISGSRTSCGRFCSSRPFSAAAGCWDASEARKTGHSKATAINRFDVLKRTIRLHISPCPNDTFMFDALVNGRIDCGELTFEVAYYDIEELNRRAEAGETDVSKISYALLPEIQSRYTLLDSGSALGRGNGPVFVARQGTPPDSIRRVAVPGMHTTANALMSRLYPSITQKKPVLFSEIAPAVARGEYDAGVLIHEGRFVYRKLGLELVADLGELWESRTGLPLPLGAIVARRTLPEELRCEIERLLRTSIEYAFAHREESRTYIKEHARELDDRVIDHHIDFFVNSYSLSLGDEGRRAVRELTGVEV